MRVPALVPLISLLAFALLPGTGQGQVYSWKDASGKVHYGDRPPAERQPGSRKLPGAPVETADVEAARKASAERQFSEREKQGKAEESAGKPPETPAQARERAANCRQAKAGLAALESGQMRFSLNDKGERVALDGGAREAEIAKARKSVDSWCKPPK